MPLIPSNYNPPHLFKNGHFSTIYAGLVRKVNGVHYERERIETPDHDFIDLDWSFSKSESTKLVIILHGLEGSSQRPYIIGSAKIFNHNGFDTVSMNMRSCSGEPNKQFRTYHSGATEDLEVVINHIVKQDKYDQIIIKGFSLGGNLTLKYLGEDREIPKHIKGAIAVSAPCNLYGSMLEIHKLKNKVYANRFKRNLLEKLRQKQQQFPDWFEGKNIKDIITLKDFDDFYTSKAHGYIDALDYYEKASSLPYLQNIKTPTLLINALNDSFLSEKCFPKDEAIKNDTLYLEIPKYGGHVGFYDKNNQYYNEKRSLNFVNEL
ncbi:alpha/beta fold hydrolase [Spongiivirga sp. MCCC 1A20706]|uniref:YheT family hydrolase n=1 Tax=Spongiivirga sp. MCCC 1A20706 TaxID=3160963 RepID=UPI00397772AA